ncbi:RpiB/LacA/LacB family sugar-phosphate isomerase [Sporolactobacillus shoreae]|uniref:RpiB/LacA/LacB family sugar-phosphate isomerase n=1 Tax=Sporolactobacillus shoreae TaxID=1465501 RepID=A0A4Z0GK45_9BACL|nr:RpiB/LacA/LacB family sugar-phosphate isomerase [Sporolactobacillus shoreae]TGA96997.1 RpiB/LacA/LacB family sugar-phosphate isomerase [Sporolactobacillus shoreae]
MKVIIGADKDGAQAKDELVRELKEEGYEILDLSKEGQDFVDVAVAVAKETLKETDNGKDKSENAPRGIVIDKWGTDAFMAANKLKYVICANVSDEHSARMTRRHNGALLITLGTAVVGPALLKSCAKAYLEAPFDGGRHMVRIDMVNKMA